VPLEHIIRAMQVQADDEIGKINRAADEEAAQLIAEAESAAVAIRARHRARVEPLLATEAAGLQNEARLGALRAIANAREELITDAFAQAKDSLEQIRESMDYAAIFRALAQEAVQALGTDFSVGSGQSVTVRVDPCDTAVVHDVFADLGVNVEIETQAIPLGGLEETTRDGRIVIVNTLTSRLERARKILRGPVARILTAEKIDEQ
jgi:vacuolar-type H+-ATPase subunit E/Vma4